MTDEERILRAVKKGDRMLGPVEKQRCPDHPHRWETYRWVWRVPADGDHLAALENGDAQMVRSCSECIAESDGCEAS